MHTTFEFNGEKYKKASKHQKEWGNHLISELHLRGNERILDLGCGDGVLTERLSQLVPEGSVLGIDASVGMIETAKQLVGPNLEFLPMDINTMDFSNEFDVVFSNAALHWVKDHKTLLNNTFAALRNNGIVMWNFAGYGTCSSFCDVVRTTMTKKQYRDYFAAFEWPWFMPSQSEYQTLMEPIGFSSVEVTEENRDRFFSTADEMIGWIDQPSIVPFLSCLPEKEKEPFRNDVVEQMLNQTLRPDGTYFETFRRIHVKAKK